MDDVQIKIFIVDVRANWVSCQLPTGPQADWVLPPPLSLHKEPSTAACLLNDLPDRGGPLLGQGLTRNCAPLLKSPNSSLQELH